MQQRLPDRKLETTERDETARRLRRYRRELRRCERRLRQEQRARSKAEAIVAERDAALAGVCHDLRTPLNAIIGCAQLARSESIGRSELNEALFAIKRNARLQGTLIDDVLDLAQCTGGAIRLRREPVNVNEVLSAALAVVAHEAGQKRIRIECRPSAVPAFILGDAERLQRVLWNLLTNALKFTPSGGRVMVEVDVTDDDSAVRLRVIDTGCGIPCAFLPHIFERFERGPDASVRHKGTGLGLAIVRRLVELHGGSVHAESPGEGLGAAFTVCLPKLDIGTTEGSSGGSVQQLDTAATAAVSALDRFAGATLH